MLVSVCKTHSCKICRVALCLFQCRVSVSSCAQDLTVRLLSSRWKSKILVSFYRVARLFLFIFLLFRADIWLRVLSCGSASCDGDEYERLPPLTPAWISIPRWAAGTFSFVVCCSPDMCKRASKQSGIKSYFYCTLCKWAWRGRMGSLTSAVLVYTLLISKRKKRKMRKKKKRGRQGRVNEGGDAKFCSSDSNLQQA